MIRNLLNIDESEKQRILEMHQSATKKHYLGEQAAPAPAAGTTPAATKPVEATAMSPIFDDYLYAGKDGGQLSMSTDDGRTKIPFKYTPTLKSESPNKVISVEIRPQLKTLPNTYTYIEINCSQIDFPSTLINVTSSNSDDFSKSPNETIRIEGTSRGPVKGVDANNLAKQIFWKSNPVSYKGAVKTIADKYCKKS